MNSLAQNPGVPVPPAPPAPMVSMPVMQSTSIEGLIAEAVSLRQQLTVLRAQQSELRRLAQSSDAGVRAEARSNLAQVNVQVAQVRTSLASVEAAIRGRVRPYAGTEQPQRPPSTVPGEAIAAMSVVFMLAVLMPISIAFARRIWRRASPAKPAEDTVAPRLDRLEQAVDAIAIEIERISEGQRFVTKVMTERAAPRVAAVPASDAASSSLGEAKPFLALGAGPVEAIPVAQRQAVRQSITPH